MDAWREVDMDGAGGGEDWLEREEAGRVEMEIAAAPTTAAAWRMKDRSAEKQTNEADDG